MHIVTPLIKSRQLSARTKCNVYLKLDNAQPTGSFKLRGISHIIREVFSNKTKSYEGIVSSSGGNAGIAAAYCADLLGLKCTVVVPETTPENIRRQLRDLYGADVIVAGSVWDEADTFARELATKKNYFYVHPFDDARIWEGHSTIIQELAGPNGQWQHREQKHKSNNAPPDLIITVCGGGGLLAGILVGLERVGWSATKVLAMETDGAHSLNASIVAGKLVELPFITSAAKTLGARRVSSGVFDMVMARQNSSSQNQVYSEVVSDNVARAAQRAFADEHRILVELACAAGLTALYEDSTRERVLNGIIQLPSNANVVVVVCGGVNVNVDEVKL